MTLPVYTDLDSIGRPSVGGTLLTAWGDAVDDDMANLHGENAWTAVTFTNAWVNYGGGFDAVGYKLVGNDVLLRGAMTGGAATAAAFTLPAGYRPTATKYFATSNSSNGVNAITVLTTGVVNTVTGAFVSFVSLDGIRFQIT